MNLVAAFLMVTAWCYVFGAFWPRRMTNLPRLVEKGGFIASAVVIGVNLALNVPVLWYAMGVVWSMFAGLDYIGYIQYSIYGEGKGPTNEHQVFMTGWDMAIAVSCFLKV